MNPAYNCSPVLKLKKLAPLLIGLVVLAVLFGLARVFPTFPGDEWALQAARELRTDWLNDAAVSYPRSAPGESPGAAFRGFQ